jgi:hypothetical protein
MERCCHTQRRQVDLSPVKLKNIDVKCVAYPDLEGLAGIFG